MTVSPASASRAHVPTTRCLDHSAFALQERQDRILAHRHRNTIPPPMPRWERRLRSLIEWPLLKMTGKVALAAFGFLLAAVLIAVAS